MTVHDYTKEKRGWGHDCTFNPRNGGLQAFMTGWGNGIKDGDIILLSNPKSESGVAPYRIVSVYYYRDPADMWQAEVEFAPEVV